MIKLQTVWYGSSSRTRSSTALCPFRAVCSDLMQAYPRRSFCSPRRFGPLTAAPTSIRSASACTTRRRLYGSCLSDGLAKIGCNPPMVADLWGKWSKLDIYVREEAMLQHLDPWIESLADADWLAEGQAPDERQEAQRGRLSGELAEVDRRIQRLIEAIESGGKSGLLVEQLRRREAERHALRARLSCLTGKPNLTPREIEAMVAALGGVAQVLRNATAPQRAEVYASLGLVLTYDDRTKKLHVSADLARVAGRVGGGT